MKRTLCIALCSLSISSVVNAAVAYDSFGVGDSYNINVGWTVTGPSNSLGKISTAFQFTSAVTGGVGKISLALGSILGTTSYINLYSDAGDSLGTLLGSWSHTGASGTFGTNGAKIVIDAGGVPSLASGQKYWLEAEATSSDNFAWNWTNTGATANMIQGGTLFTDSDESAYRVETVPEPASLLVLGIGALLARRKRSK